MGVPNGIRLRGPGRFPASPGRRETGLDKAPEGANAGCIRPQKPVRALS